MQVTNNQPSGAYTPVESPNQDAVGFGAAMTATTAATTTASAENEAAVMDPHRRAVLDGALANMETIMNAHGAPEMAPLAKRLLENAAEEMLDLPAHIFERNVMEMAPPHILHHLFARTGKIDDPNARERGPIDIPVLDENGGLTNLSLRFPDRMGIGKHIENFHYNQQMEQNEIHRIERNEKMERNDPIERNDPMERNDPIERQILQSNARSLYVNQTVNDIPQQMQAHGARHLIGAANRTLSEAGREMRLNPDEFTLQNMKILAGHIIHHLLARDGIIDDPNAPKEGPIPVPQHLADGTLHIVPVELLMEPPQRDIA